MDILITGINGFVGTNLTQSLVNHNIYGLSSSPSTKGGRLRIYSWNELENIPPVDAVIHLAGKAHDTKNRTESQTYFDINTGLTQKIFDWFIQSNAKKFIYFSSVKAAADVVDGILAEDAKPLPNGPYGESKLRAEEYILNALGRNTGLSTRQIYILRPCMIHGTGSKGNLNLLYNIVRKGIPYPLGSFNNRRSFVSIDNVSYLVNQLIGQDIPSGIYNLADDEPISTNEVIQLMCDVMSRKCKIWHINKKIITNIAMLGNVLHLPLNQERLEKLTQNYIVSNEKTKKALSISHLPLSVKEGLTITFDSFK